MRRSKNSHRIVVQNVTYRWRVKGDDGFISIGIWPLNSIGSYIHGNLNYHETWIDCGNGIHTSANDQIIVTNRLVRRIIAYAVAQHGYSPTVKGTDFNLKNLDHVIQWEDAVRASRDPNSP